MTDSEIGRERAPHRRTTALVSVLGALALLVGVLAVGVAPGQAEAAVVTDGERRFVFVEVGPRAYARREVRVAPLAPPGSSAPRATSVAVRDGLRAGERVVVSGAFTLKSELAKASLADDEH